MDIERYQPPIFNLRLLFEGLREDAPSLYQAVRADWSRIGAFVAVRGAEADWASTYCKGSSPLRCITSNATNDPDAVYERTSYHDFRSRAVTSIESLMADFGHGGRSLPEIPLLSQMTQEGIQPGIGGLPKLEVPDDTFRQPEAKRPWSAQGIKSILSPSPTFVEARRSSKDDHDIDPAPTTPKRTTFASRGLNLQMPPRDVSSTSTANLTTNRTPVSPRPDAPTAFTSPTSVLPRRARGIDFSRAATNLHHSTLAEQSSPESSPTVGGKRGIMIPPRGKSLFSAPYHPYNPESPSMNTNQLWSTMATTEKTGLSSSVASSSMMDDDSATTSSDEDEVMDIGEDDDTIHMTPHINGIGLINPFGSVASSPGGDGVGHFSPHATKLMSYQRARMNSRRSRTRKSSSSASGRSSMHSPGPPQSPPLMRSSESNVSFGGGFVLDEPTKMEIRSRRESLSLGTNDMQLSDAEQSDDGQNLQSNVHEEIPIVAPVTPSMEERKQVVRRAVTRRSNLMPKSKTFARVKASLLEEGAPIDTEVRREAEVIRQVRESDAQSDLNLPLPPSQPATSCSSPILAPIAAGATDNTNAIPDDSSVDSRRSSSVFTSHAIKNSGGISFWNNFDERMRTPPPPMLPRSNSSAVSDEMNIDKDNAPQSSVLSTNVQQSQQNGSIRSQEASQPSGPQVPTSFEIPRKGTKRMRDDDLDPYYFKRRAVSPGLSVQNSPVLPQSPGWWGTPPPAKVERVASNGSNGAGQSGGGCAGGQPKRVGMQGMNDTNDGLMNMSIE